MSFPKDKPAHSVNVLHKWIWMRLRSCFRCMTRLIFTLNFHLKKARKPEDKGELPFLLVYEEAHNYIPQSEGARYGSVKKAIERIAKEGRKYGISLMIVSQRPSEISETVFSQCNFARLADAMGHGFGDHSAGAANVIHHARRHH